MKVSGKVVEGLATYFFFLDTHRKQLVSRRSFSRFEDAFQLRKQQYLTIISNLNFVQLVMKSLTTSVGRLLCRSVGALQVVLFSV